jgi:hypothetical protein
MSAVPTNETGRATHLEVEVALAGERVALGCSRRRSRPCDMWPHLLLRYRSLGTEQVVAVEAVLMADGRPLLAERVEHLVFCDNARGGVLCDIDGRWRDEPGRSGWRHLFVV